MRALPQVAWVALVSAGTTAVSMLTFISPGRRVFHGIPGKCEYRSRCGLPQSGSYGWASSRQPGGLRHDRRREDLDLEHGRRNAATLYALKTDSARTHQRRHRRHHDKLFSVVNDGRSTAIGAGGAATADGSRGKARTRRSGTTGTVLKAKGTETTTTKTRKVANNNAGSTTPAQRRKKQPSSSLEQTIKSADVEKGTRVRLRDTGRLGTVVGKKAGGWWIVDLFDSWGAGGAAARTSRTDKVAELHLSPKRRKRSKSEVVPGASESAIDEGVAETGGCPVSTRRINMEPLGNAYAEDPSVASASAAATAAAYTASATKGHSANVSKRHHSTSAKSGTSSPKRNSSSTGKGKSGVNGDRSATTAAGKAKRKSGKAATASSAGRRPKGAGTAPLVMPSADTAGVGTIAAAAVPAATANQSTLEIHYVSGEGLAHADMKEWLIFSDLHVSPASLDVSLEVLDRVNEEAMKRSACGIAFLGDFWHARGSLKVDLLVPVMEKLAAWTRPVIMIPGNHDQVTFGGGMHALTPLQFAFTDPAQALVISEPSIFLDALWLPHRRNNTAMETLLRSQEAQGARAIFCHVDIKGAAMNDGVSSHSGIPKSAFPPSVPAFSGHFHKPHTVGDGFIRYIGSPYQTSLSESGQSKALVVLDAATWAEKETIPLDIGRRFFRVKGDDQPLPEVGEACPGDRVVWTVRDAASEAVRRRAAALQKEMVDVEIREAPRPFSFFSPQGSGVNKIGNMTSPAGGVGNPLDAAMGNGFPDAASLLPEALFRMYLEREREGGRNISGEIERLGFELIKELGLQASSKDGNREDRHTSLALHSIELKNFGPFRDEVTYPLDDRGVVLLRGSNLDDSGADSNGAGKTTLAMSALWALAGVVDARPVSDGRVADVVHEPSRATPMSPLISMPTSDAEAEGTGNAAPRAGVAEATLTGTLNGKPLWLRRRKGARVNQLFLKHDGKDLTRQIAKETQTVLEDELGLSPHVLVRGIFQGQHHMNGLLESTDAQLKEDLALLMPMGIWQDLASRSRATARKSDEEAARFRERAATRQEDLERLTDELKRAQREVNDRTADRVNAHVGVDGGERSSVATLLTPDPCAESNSTSSANTTADSTATEAVVPSPSENSKSSDATVKLRVDTNNDKSSTAAGSSTEVVAAEAAAKLVSKKAKRDARQARDDAEIAEESLRLLRVEVEGLAESWTDQKMKLLGEAKAAQERVSFLRRDVERAECQVKESEMVAKRVQDAAVLLRRKDTDLSEMFRPLSDDHDGDHPSDTALATASEEVKDAEALAVSTRAIVADAQAAFRHAREAVQTHARMEVVGQGDCHTCGQPVNGGILRERAEILQVSQSVAAADLRRFERELSINQRLLEAARSRSALLQERARLGQELEEAQSALKDSGEELRARQEELRRVENEASTAERKADDHAKREGALRRDWAAKTKAAGWALKAHRDKQTFAQHELAEAVAREGELQLQAQTEQSEQRRLQQAEEVARTKLREIEATVARVRDELEEVQEKERSASALKATSTALAEHLGVRGVQNFLFRDAVNQLQANVARYLDALSDGALLLRLSMDGDRVVKRASARAADGGFRDRSLSQLSGGQWRRASLSLELAFAELARQRSRFSCNVLVLDEVLSQLDAYGRQRVAHMLRALAHGRAADDESGVGATEAMYSTILVVLQDLPAEELQESFDRVDQVVKHRDSSSVIVNSHASNA